MNIYVTALILSTIAGLATLIGGFITFFIKRNSMRVLSIGLGFSAGVMIFISLVDLLPMSASMVIKTFGDKFEWVTLAGFAIGILIAILIDYFIPDHLQDKFLEHGDHSHLDEEEHGFFKTPEQIKKIKRVGLTTAIAVAIHNFPEGLTTFFATTASIKLGLSIFTAIAIHNIPEGIAIAVPIYQATGSKRKALSYCLLAGLAEPIGGILGFGLIHFFFPELTIGVMFALIAGIMTYISFDTILPLSKEYDTAHYSITGVVLGMLLIGFTIFAF